MKKQRDNTVGSEVHETHALAGRVSSPLASPSPGAREGGVVASPTHPPRLRPAPPPRSAPRASIALPGASRDRHGGPVAPKRGDSGRGIGPGFEGGGERGASEGAGGRDALAWLPADRSYGWKKRAIVDLCRRGYSRPEIIAATNSTLGAVNVVVNAARRSGALSARPVNPLRALMVTVSEDSLAQLRIEAVARDLSIIELVGRLLRMIARDDLFAAVLDDAPR